MVSLLSPGAKVRQSSCMSTGESAQRNRELQSKDLEYLDNHFVKSKSSGFHHAEHVQACRMPYRHIAEYRADIQWNAVQT